jgi:hypothetical protein
MTELIGRKERAFCTCEMCWSTALLNWKTAKSRFMWSARCAVYYTASWQGSPLRAPVASLRPWLLQGVEPVSEPADRIAGQTLAWLGDVPLHLHRTMDQWGYRAPLKPTRGRLRSPCPHRLGGRSCPQDPRPLHGDQPCAAWMPPSCRRWITPRGLSPPLNLARQTWRSDLSTDTEPCTIDRSIALRSGERSCFPRHPLDPRPALR